MKLSKRWLPAIIVPSLIAAGAIVLPIQANAVDLPDVTPQQLMLLMDSEVRAFSGTVVKTSDLGLPALELSSMMNEDMITEMEEKMPEGFEEFIPSIIEQNAITQAVELIAGEHKMRIYASEEGLRVQVLDTMSQRDLIINKDTFWFYDAKKATVLTGGLESKPEVSEQDKQAAIDEATAKLEEYAATIALDLSSPEAVANYLLEQVGPSTNISVGQDHRAAGRTAYQLIAEPKSANSLISSVVVSVDSETGMALDVAVFSKEQEEPAFKVGFESISFETPAASVFSFTPPAGTTVETIDLDEQLPAEFDALKAELEALELEDLTEAELAQLKADLEAEYSNKPKPEMIGSDWESVFFLPQVPSEVPMELFENELFLDMMIQVPGGRVFSTPVLNVLITDSGEVYAGSVTIEFLRQVASR
jgi:outer membrane lipoprotein-sorting protein